MEFPPSQIWVEKKGPKTCVLLRFRMGRAPPRDLTSREPNRATILQKLRLYLDYLRQDSTCSTKVLQYVEGEIARLSDS